VDQQISAAPVKHTHVPLDQVLRRAYVLLSGAATVTTAVVFVHGFKGDPVETWTQFQTIIDTHAEEFPDWERTDVFFFDYDSTKASIDDSKHRLLEFVGKVYPSFHFDTEAALPVTRTYSRLILVGHSEGGVVIRAAIAFAGKKFDSDPQRAPILTARVALFAPAIFGFRPTSWIGVVTSFTIFQKLFNLYVAKSTPATELWDKTVLEQLTKVTEHLWSNFPDVTAYRAHVLYGSDEHIVLRSCYLQDCEHTPEPNKDHIMICKPSNGYTRPLAFVFGDCSK